MTSDADDTEVTCYKKVKNCQEVSEFENYIGSLAGVKDFSKLLEFIEEKESWYKQPIVPILLSGFMTSLIIFGIIYDLAELDNIQKIISIVIPFITTIVIQIIFRYFSNEPII